jgi:cation diffusion facilitator family transporter
MHDRTVSQLFHTHTFGADSPQKAEARTWWVIGLTMVTMMGELIGGYFYGSMALLADGWHMGTHAAALGITVFAFRYARMNAKNPQYSFGTGKVSALGGFASAIVLGFVGIWIFAESAHRFIEPVQIVFNQAIAVAMIGLAVNLLSAFLLRGGGGHHHGEHHHDHNLRGAFLHVLADALTSCLAIVALLAGKFLNVLWVDPLVGMVGSLVIARWALSLVKDTSKVLLDAELNPEAKNDIKEIIESDSDNRVVDFHFWRIGPHHFAAIIGVVTHEPRPPEYYKTLLEDRPELAHVTIEVHRCGDLDCG